MKSNSRLLLLILILVAVAGCSSGNSSSGNSSSGNSSSGNSSSGPAAAPAVQNVLPITVNGSLCSSGSYINKPCISVTVCTPGTSICQTVSDILLDTGSYGLRIFQSVLTGVSLTQITNASGSIARCVQYADGTAEWGPVQTADVILGGEPAVTVPIQVIDSTFGSVPKTCGTPDRSPSSAGFNGILGVGPFAEDCGSDCASNAVNGSYYACNGSACAGTAVALSSQVQNPVALLPQDNNGVIVQLPAVPLGGTTSVDGSLVLGIDTQSNNASSGVTMYPADQYGEFITVFNDSTYNQSFIDSGSNGLYFPPPSANVLPVCSGINSGFYCPASTTSFSATNEGYTGSPSGTVSFQIGNFIALYNSTNSVFAEIGGNSFGRSFIWGLPFYLGRNVYVGIEGKTSSLGTGPYWAY